MIDSTWRFLCDPPQSAVLNMATDEAISIAFSEGKVPSTLRFYRWNHPTFSIGAFQSLDEDWITALENHGIGLIRRITGGRGLLHENELTYSLIASTDNPLFPSGIKGTFQSIANGLLAGLHQLGVDAAVFSPSRASRKERSRTLCFDAVSLYEITAQEKKLIGSAQRRWKSHFLQHGSLILCQNRTEQSPGKWDRASLTSENQITLEALCPSLPEYETLSQTLKNGFEAALSIELTPGKISPYEHEIINRLVKEKYGRTEWNRTRKI